MEGLELRNLESQTQRAFIKWCRLHEKKYPSLKLAFSIPNGGQRNIVTASILKAEGSRPGVPDWCMLVQNTQYIGLWIEFKSPKGVLSPAQQDYIALLEANGHAVCVCTDWQEATKIVIQYLNSEL